MKSPASRMLQPLWGLQVTTAHSPSLPTLCPPPRPAVSVRTWRSTLSRTIHSSWGDSFGPGKVVVFRIYYKYPVCLRPRPLCSAW